MRRRIGALVLALVLAASTAAYLTRSTGPSYPKAWDARVLTIVHFVEQERGLTFKHPVAVRFLADKEFVAKVRDPAPTSKQRKAAELALEELRALGLVSGHPDLFKAQNDLSASDVVGVYMPEEKTLYVRGTTLTPYIRATAAHELTHALQDQYFGLEKLRRGPEDDTAVTTLIEGDAVRVEQAYERQLSAADKKAYAEESGVVSEGAKGVDVPQVLQDEQALPYVFGPVLLDTLLADGGNSSVDGAFRRPPRTDAQVLDPRTYPIGWKAASLPQPRLPAHTKRLDDASPFGQLGLFEVLGSRLGFTRAWAAVQGWSGDSSRPYRLDGKTCVALDVRMKDATGATRLEDAVHAWAAGLPATVGVDRSDVHLRSCDPGAGKAVTSYQPWAFTVLSARAGVIDVVMNEGQGFTRSSCYADGLISRIGEAMFAALNDTQPSPAETRRLVVATRAAAAAC